ncbi:MAG TPA: hypothetical protein VF017_19510 [Thermoanaerobaculia bacterium]|nr:hypothetical protein [Thermoanaerobaculia bacterium]
MNTVIALALVLFSGLGVSAAQDSERAALAAQLAVEEQLVTAVTTRLSDLRRQEAAALQSVAEAAQSVDEEVAAARPRVEELERRIHDREVAQAVLTVLTARVGEAQARLMEQLRRQAALRQALDKVPVPPAGDPISGRWRVEIASPPASGTFEMRLDGNQVSGSWELGLRRGSLRGSFAARRLRLERLDPERGLDGIFEAEVDPLLGTARGVWTPVELAVGEAGGSGWSAVRLTQPPSTPEDSSPEARQEEEEELEPR